MERGHFQIPFPTNSDFLFLQNSQPFPYSPHFSCIGDVPKPPSLIPGTPRTLKAQPGSHGATTAPPRRGHRCQGLCVGSAKPPGHLPENAERGTNPGAARGSRKRLFLRTPHAHIAGICLHPLFSKELRGFLGFTCVFRRVLSPRASPDAPAPRANPSVPPLM